MGEPKLQGNYRKCPKLWDNHLLNDKDFNIQTKRFYHGMIPSKDVHVNDKQ